MITEEMLRRAAARSSEELTAQLEEGYDPQHPHEFSPAFQSRMRRLTQRAAHPFLHTALRRVAAVFLAVLIGSSAWLATDAEARSAFIGWVTETSGNLFVYRYEGESFYEPAEYRLGYIPEGYSEIFADVDEVGGTVLYRDTSDRQISFLYSFEGDGNSLYLGNADLTNRFKVTVNGFQGEYLCSDDETISSSLLWTNESEYLLCITGFLERNELLRIAESVEKIN